MFCEEEGGIVRRSWSSSEWKQEKRNIGEDICDPYIIKHSISISLRLPGQCQVPLRNIIDLFSRRLFVWISRMVMVDGNIFV